MNLFDNKSFLKRDPEVLSVLMYPNPTLNQVSKLVTTSIPDDIELQNLIENMRATLEHYKALGLAAIQVGVPLRLLLVKDANKTHIIINPIVKSSCGSSYETEGCL